MLFFSNFRVFQFDESVMKSMLKLTLVAVALAIPTSPVLSQEMSAEDILKRLEAQRSRTLGFVEQSDPDNNGDVTAASEPSDEAPVAATGTSTLQLVTGSEDTSGSVATDGSSGTETGLTALAKPQNEVESGMLPSVETATVASDDFSFTIDLTIYFGFDSAILKPASKSQLDALCQAVIADRTGGKYRIIGHTDAKGKASYNKRLSQARADEVVRYMVDTCRIKPSRLEAVGEGENRPRVANDPNASENRRVEVQVVN